MREHSVQRRWIFTFIERLRRLLIGHLRISGGDGRQQVLFEIALRIKTNSSTASRVSRVRWQLRRAQQLIAKLGIVTTRCEHQILTQLIQRLHLIAVGAVPFQNHLREHRAGIGQQTTRARRAAIPEHVAGGNLDANAVLRQLQRRRFAHDLLKQQRRFLFQLGFLFLLLVR